MRIPSKQQLELAKSDEYSGLGSFSQLSVFIVFLTGFTQYADVSSWSKITLLCLLANSARFQIKAWFKLVIFMHSYVMGISIDNFNRFQELVVHHAFLVQPNKQQQMLMVVKDYTMIFQVQDSQDSYSPVTIRCTTEFPLCL